MGMFPVSFVCLKTAFMFALLDNFIWDNVECGTSALNCCSKLRWMTSSVFPHSVPDRYRELMRVSRQWRQLKLLKWHGFGHERREPHDGELALFCPSCPQPGINVTLPSEDNSTPQWLHSRSLVMDGNFKAEHLHPMHPEDEVWLTDGKGFMVGRARYWAHLMIAKDSYHKHFWRRVDDSLHMSVPLGMDIILGIRLWHVHRHQDKCFAWYASNFIPGAARINREIMETLWAPLNVISPSRLGMSTLHRQECLDYQMNDCNFMKMIQMG
ncbi:hypothetical protein BDR06DRAFT_984585 [Suillus hirtellus]|nr:hypothetical protein BDR06DRAFT_984585 [Suillus hirtellus]